MSAKVAIVAGAGGALGRATVASLAAAGLTVVAVDRNEDALRELPGTVHREVVSKAALVHLTRVLDIELREHGIRVNAVVPQLLDTAVNRGIFPEQMIAHAVTPEAVAAVIAFLVSDAAAPVSGAILPAYGA
jgi:NAD(P)-dependent dehydrogenase (short-subunit alcohol dehydrogenase family)